MTGSSFSVATTVFVSLAICAVISYGIFYYFKQRLSLIEKSQMEQARIMQALISHGLMQPQGNQNQNQGQQQGQQQQHGQQPQVNQGQQQGQQQWQQQGQQLAQCKEITITQKGLIEVSSDSDDDSSDDSDSKSSDSDSSSNHNAANDDDDKWSIGDEIHQPDSYHEEFEETFRKNVLIDAISIDSSYVVDNVIVENSNKKIISLKESLNHDAELSDAESESSSSSSSSSPSEKNENHENEEPADSELNLKIGYKPKKESLHLNYGNMSVPALRQLVKERGLGGEDADLQKLKKKDLMQLLQPQ
jgi:hypothetical protein